MANKIDQVLVEIPDSPDLIRRLYEQNPEFREICNDLVLLSAMTPSDPKAVEDLRDSLAGLRAELRTFLRAEENVVALCPGQRKT